MHASDGWKRIDRSPSAVAEDAVTTCPQCQKPTDSLKQYRCLHWCLYYLAGAMWRTEYVRGCPACMRRHLARRCLLNVVPSNLLWPLLVVPWTAVLFATTFRRGHSPAVVSGILPHQAAEQEAARRMADNELSWGRVSAIIALLLCWIPLLGLPFALVAYLLNRKSGDWRRAASIAALAINVLTHVALVVLIAVNAK